MVASKSVIKWHPWQDRFFRDQSRVIEAIWHRQAGKDFAAAGKAVDNAVRTGQDWFIISVAQRQSDTTFAKCTRFAEAFKQLLKLAGAITFSEREYVEYDREIDEKFHCTARTLHLPGGGSVTALPGRNPDTLAGLTGNIIFTEFALFPKGGYDHWRVIFPLATRGFQVLVITTPRGRNTKAFEIFSDRETYSIHLQTIEDSVREGFTLYDNQGKPTTIERFKKLYGDEAGWRREYMCEWTGDLDALVRWAQLAAAGEMGRNMAFDLLRVERGSGWSSGFFKRLAGQEGRAELGWDVARHANFSSLAVNVSRPGHVRQLRCLVLMHECEFALQRAIITEAMNTTAANVGAGDATGLGMDSNETLHTKYGDRWLPFTFTSAAKREIGSLLATCFGDQDQIIPPADGEHKYIATDVYAVQKEGDAETLKLVETANPLLPASHCDIAYSLALARKAAAIQVAQGHLWVA